MAALHDMRCTVCEAVELNQLVPSDGNYSPCAKCGGKRTWIPSFVPMTDVYGSTKTSEILYEAVGKPATYSSRRELERKMHAIGFDPCGDKVGGARNEDGYRGTSFSIAGKTTRATPRATRPRHDR